LINIIRSVNNLPVECPLLIEKSVNLLKNARGHLILFQNNFPALKYFYRASSEKKSPWASLEEKSPWASFSIPKYFSVFKYFYRTSSKKKEPVGIFFYSQIFFQSPNIFTGHLQKKELAGILRRKEPIGIFFYSQIFFQYSNIFTGHLQ